ncbi:hypothetical protein X777_03163, partial [Ooceraea biroi]
FEFDLNIESKAFLVASAQIQEQSSYSADFTRYGFRLFSKLKLAMKAQHHDRLAHPKSFDRFVLQAIPKTEYVNCFDKFF